MALEVVWADVVVGSKPERLRVDGAFVKSIKIEPTSMVLVAEMEDGSMRSYIGCPYVLCTKDDGKPDIAVPDKEIVTP